MTEDEVRDAIEALDKAFPEGWRSGDKFTDALMVRMMAGGRKIGRALFPEVK